MGNSMKLPKLKIELPMTHQLHFWKYVWKKPETLNSKESKHSYVQWSIIYNSQDFETAQVPISRWYIKKLWYIYTMEYYLAVKKKKKEDGNLTFCDSMDGQGQY